MVETIALILRTINLFAAYLAEIVRLFSAGDGGDGFHPLEMVDRRWKFGDGNQGGGN